MTFLTVKGLLKSSFDDPSRLVPTVHTQPLPLSPLSNGTPYSFPTGGPLRRTTPLIRENDLPSVDDPSRNDVVLTLGLGHTLNLTPFRPARCPYPSVMRVVKRYVSVFFFSKNKSGWSKKSAYVYLSLYICLYMDVREWKGDGEII